MLILVALFVFVAARNEAMMARVQESTGGVHVGDLMQRHFRTVRADSRLAELASWLPLTPQRDFPVLHRGRLVGMLRSSDLVTAMAAGQGERLASEIMQRDVPTVLSEDGVMETFVKMQKVRLGSLPVADAGILVGILPRERVHRWLESFTSNSNPCASQA
jgi:predicted transcriptional regulator